VTITRNLQITVPEHPMLPRPKDTVATIIPGLIYRDAAGHVWSFGTYDPWAGK
jgi:hypothetical protein